MSYPRRVHTLIVDDDPIAQTNYRHLFETLGRTYDLAPPCIVPSYADAQECLASSDPFHLVIVDLQLPMAAREAPEQGTSPGLALIKQAAERDHLPVPALLVISGQLRDTQYKLQDQLRRDFWYGRAVNKSVDEDEAVPEALNQCLRYNDVGIHMETDEKEDTYPPLSPREEDLLRRCVLEQSECLGVNLSWWSAERQTGDRRPWTKVLQGRFLLDSGQGQSRPVFFKFTPAEYAELMHSESLLMSRKLGHIKVVYHLIGRHRALLATEKVGEGNERPTSLVSFLQRKDEAVTASVPDVVGDLVTQLAFLGGRVTPTQKPRSELLSRFLDRTRIAAAWERFGDQLARTNGDNPLDLFDSLVTDKELVWVDVQNCTHGDLNVTNVALDEGPHGIRGYIFDASGMGAAPTLRDLAALEVTSLLHQPLASDETGVATESLVARCSVVYETFVPCSHQSENPDYVAANTIALIATIRTGIIERRDLSIYALLVFDQALIQLSGLTYSLSGNKISVPEEAARLAARVAQWARKTSLENTA